MNLKVRWLRSFVGKIELILSNSTPLTQYLQNRKSILMKLRTIFLSIVFLLWANICSAETLSVNANNVNLRSGPSTTAAVKWEYGKGFPLKVLTRKGDWVKVQDFEKDIGWVHKTLLTKTKHVIVNKNRNSKKIINIRNGPSTKESIVAKAYYGVVFEVIEKKSGWIRVKHDSGLEGWIKATLLWGAT